MKIHSGEVILLNFFDVGGEVNLEEIKDILQKFGPVESEFPGTYTRYWIAAGKLSLKIKVSERVEVKVYPVGAIITRERIKIENRDFEEVIDIINENEAKAKEAAMELAKKITKAMEQKIFNKYEKFELLESYKIILAFEADHGGGLDGKIVRSSDILRHKKDIVGLLRGEKMIENISDDEIGESLQLRHSFSGRDLVVIDWSGAFVYCNLEIYGNVLHMIELARLQLLQLKVYDALLDKMLKDANKVLTMVGTPFITKRISEKLSETSSMRIEIVSVIEDVMNIGKVAKDRTSIETYELASKRFALDYWFASVNSKIEKLDDIYKSAYEKLQTARNISLEWMIVILIVIEIILFIGIEIINIILSK